MGPVQQVGVPAQVDATTHRADRTVHRPIVRPAPRPDQSLPSSIPDLRDTARVYDVRDNQPVIRSLISAGRSTSMKCPTPSISSASEPGPP